MNNKSSGLSVSGVVQIVLIVLKIVGVIDWSWRVVLIPLWIDIILLVVIVFWLWLKDAWRL